MFIFIKRINFLIIITTIVLILGLIKFNNSVPQENFNLTEADAVIVLTGDRGKRIEKAYDLIERTKYNKMFISGVGGSKEVLRKILGFDEAVMDCCIEFGYKAMNTYQNAIEVKFWALNNNVSSIFLVTTDLHMQRALFLFQQITNLEIQIYPIAYKDRVVPLEKLFSEYIKYIISKIVFIKKYED